jgi:phosphopantothenoylcysteine decarboxylase/phosphopantothenate--cysteine ligase
MTYSERKVLVGISGGIAAYKAAELVQELKRQGALVKVVMTQAAQAFITPLTLQALSGNRVYSELFDLEAEAAMGHIELARWPDVIVIAPASANCLAKLAHGMADDLLTTLCLATTKPIVLVPAMNQAMWHNSITQQNLATLQQHGFKVLGPASGEQACGDTGFGRMLEPLSIIENLLHLF